MAKSFEKQVVEMTEQKESQLNAKRAGKSNAASQEVASNQIEKLGVNTPKSVREFYAKEQKENALSIAESVVSNFIALFPDVYKYTFEEAKGITKNFNLYCTTSEESYKDIMTIGEKSIYLREITPDTPDVILRSFESCKIYFEALRIEKAKKERENAKTMANLEITAKFLNMSVSELLAMKRKKEEANTESGLVLVHSSEWEIEN